MLKEGFMVLQGQMKSLVAFVKKSVGTDSECRLTPTTSVSNSHRSFEDITNKKAATIHRQPSQLLNTSKASHHSLDVTVVNNSQTSNGSQGSRIISMEPASVEYPNTSGPITSITINDLSMSMVSSLDTTAKMEPDFQFEVSERQQTGQESDWASLYMNEFEVVLKKKNGSFGVLAGTVDLTEPAGIQYVCDGDGNVFVKSLEKVGRNIASLCCHCAGWCS